MTTTPDFCALGAKIIELWDADCDIDVEINELRELLATPPSEPPTEQDFREMFDENDWNYISPETFEDIARTVLERWG